MRLVIGEYLRCLRERDELDRLLPDLLVEMGYVPVARPQTGNRQFGVDLAARGKHPVDGKDELLLLVIKQGDIGRTEWSTGIQSVRQSIYEIFDVYLRAHSEPEDQNRRIRIALVTNGEIKQTVLADWSGCVTDYQARATIEFWGMDKLAELVECHLFDEFVFRDEDRKQLRRALALSGDSEYDQLDLHQLFLRTLGLKEDGSLQSQSKAEKELLKALRIVNLSAHIFSSWSSNDGDARQGIRAMERAMLWSWHRIQLSDESSSSVAIVEAFSSLWLGYQATAKRYFEKIQGHCYVKDGLYGYYSNGLEFSLVAFEQIGILSSIGLAQLALTTSEVATVEAHQNNARVLADALANVIENNDICNSPCLDRHSNDITSGLTLLLLTGFAVHARQWLMKLVRNVDYAYKAKRYVPISTDSFDDLVEAGGWNDGHADERLMNMSWTLPTLAGWCVILGLDEQYKILARGSKEAYPEVCMQLWHPDAKIYDYLYFKQAQYASGATEAPIVLPSELSDWQAHMLAIVNSEQAKIAVTSPAAKAGILALDIVASRHFQTPIAPYFWYQFATLVTNSEENLSNLDKNN